MSVLALTMGEPGGIGPELALRAWQALRHRPDCAFALIASSDIVAARNRDFCLDVPLVHSDLVNAARHFAAALPIIALDEHVTDHPGQALTENAPAVIASIRQAVAAVTGAMARAVITNPIQKSSLYAAGFSYPGHTEFLGALAAEAGARDVYPVMMLACRELRVVPVTVHIALNAVSTALKADTIVRVGRIVAASLSELFSINAPRLAIAGLNPHAGEDGSMGSEDQTIIAPAIARLRELGIDARGPLPADTMFHATARRTYDAALCMYHDQALIPVKTLAFDEAVNVTLGLPFVRTSPDHGTALDIATAGTARPDSLIAAIELAASLTGKRA